MACSEESVLLAANGQLPGGPPMSARRVSSAIRTGARGRPDGLVLSLVNWGVYGVVGCWSSSARCISRRGSGRAKTWCTPLWRWGCSGSSPWAWLCYLRRPLRRPLGPGDHGLLGHRRGLGAEFGIVASPSRPGCSAGAVDRRNWSTERRWGCSGESHHLDLRPARSWTA